MTVVLALNMSVVLFARASQLSSFFTSSLQQFNNSSFNNTWSVASSDTELNIAMRICNHDVMNKCIHNNAYHIKRVPYTNPESPILFGLSLLIIVVNMDTQTEDLLTGDAVDDEPQGISPSHGCYI